jgi:recombinational DNA repair protein RecR
MLRNLRGRGVEGDESLLVAHRWVIYNAAPGVSSKSACRYAFSVRDMAPAERSRLTNRLSRLTRLQ